MTIDEAIERYTNNAEYERTHDNLQGCLDFKQLAEWLRELKALKDFANFVAESVMDEEFEENSGFYAEVYCRKLYKMGFIEAEDNKWIFNKEEVE